MGLEGIVAKRRDSRYRSGRSRDWIKIKNMAHPAIERAMLIALSNHVCAPDEHSGGQMRGLAGALLLGLCLSPSMLAAQTDQEMIWALGEVGEECKRAPSIW
jgi:hypothetical protein